jgi:CheY-like chemotaxis protein
MNLQEFIDSAFGEALSAHATGNMRGRINTAPEHHEAIYERLAHRSDCNTSSEAPGAAAGGGPATEAARQTLLVADDDDLVRATIVATLEDAGYDVVEVGDGEEALAFLDAGESAVAGFVSDIRMPKLDGLELARVVAHRWPRIALVLVSGYPTGGRLAGVPESAVFVPKPFKLEELAAAVKRALSSKGN